MKEWYTIENVDTLDTPTLVIYPARVKANLEILKSFISDIGNVRPHVKTNKCPQVVKLMIEAGITKFKCATIAEAEMVAMEGGTDILLAYQPTGPKVRRLLELQRKFPGAQFACLVDHAKVLSELSSLARQSSQHLRVYIDINAGMNRTGILPGKDALQLALMATEAPSIELIGLHLYDGHLRDNDLTIRTQRCDQAFKPASDLRADISSATGKNLAMVAGGTPTFPIHAKRKNVETSPGTFIFWDKGYQQLLSEQPFGFAALVVARVISVPDEHTLCIDLGHKSIASENPIGQRVHLLNATGLEPIGHSEEHMVFRTAAVHQHEPGDIIYGVPQHICPTVALYDDAAVCTDNIVRDRWPIAARRRKITV